MLYFCTFDCAEKSKNCISEHAISAKKDFKNVVDSLLQIEIVSNGTGLVV